MFLAILAEYEIHFVQVAHPIPVIPGVCVSTIPVVASGREALFT